jgi:hypothetical protein
MHRLGALFSLHSPAHRRHCPSAAFALLPPASLPFLVQLDEPTELTPDDVSRIGQRYGINMQKDQLEGLQKVYGQYLENIIPVGDQQLT